MKVTVKAPHSVEFEKTTFLPGESFDLPDEEAMRLLKKNRVTVTASPEAKKPEETKVDSPKEDLKDPDDMKVDELKAELKEREIEIPSDARKDDLIDLVKKARG